MWNMPIANIMCFHCVAPVGSFTIGDAEHVSCVTCGRHSTVEKAVDDCFIFVVANASSGLQQQGMRAVVDYMPRQADERQNHVVKDNAISFLRVRQRAAA